MYKYLIFHKKDSFNYYDLFLSYISLYTNIIDCKLKIKISQNSIFNTKIPIKPLLKIP